jgi:DNA-binding HxlR family transcriptional regulator
MEHPHARWALRTFEVVGHRWSALALCALAERGALRRKELAAAIPAVSTKVLTETLRRLERDGLVVRTEHPSNPPRVDYDLTPLGNEAHELIQSVRRWGERWLPEIEAARAAHGG